MLLGTRDPFRALLELQRALDARRTGDWLRGQTGARGAFPPINIFRQGENYVAIIELAGIDKNKLEIEAKENVLRISGQKSADYPEDSSAHRYERLFGSFDRTLSVPVTIDADNIKAEYRDGILALHIPQAEEDKPRKIQIK